MIDENVDFHSFVYSEEVLELVRSANAFAGFLEEFSSSEARVFIGDAVKYLSGVYNAMLQVGDTEAVFDSQVEATVSEQEWSAVYQRISMLLGPNNDILRIAEEDEFDDSELVSHTISEDLSDLYQELRDFTSVYSRGIEELMNDAAWELKERFNENWGKKLLRTLSALHELYVSGIDPGEE